MGSEWRHRDGDLLDQYRAISNKLKKRFLRKPNVAEACESFSALAHQCESQQLPSYAGLCWISTARCEGSLSNVPGESACLVRAARQFSEAEQADLDCLYSSPNQENLGAALGCYSYAISRCTETSPLAVGLHLEIVDCLRRAGKSDLLEEHLMQAIEMCDGDSNLDTKVHCQALLAQFYTESGNFVGALSLYSNIVEDLEKAASTGSRAEILLKCEINRVFLLLILKPTPQKLTPELLKVLEKYTWGDSTDDIVNACGMSAELHLSIQSLVTCCQSSDLASLDALESQLSPLLEKEERNLLRVLVKLLLNS